MQTNPRIEMDMTRYETPAIGGDGEESGSDSDEYEGVGEDWTSVVDISCIFLFFLISNSIPSCNSRAIHQALLYLTPVIIQILMPIIVPRQPYSHQT